jgi:acetyltransferase-like isoleucine patch superfamily enzyme
MGDALFDFVRKVRSFVLQFFVDRNAIKKHHSAQLNVGRIKLKNGCKVVVGESSIVDSSIMFDRENAVVVIGKRVFFNGRIVAAQQVEIGDDVMVSWGVTLVDHNSHSLAFSQRSQDVLNVWAGTKDWDNVKISPIKIESKVWIGFDAIILKGVTIGEGSVVGAGAVIAKDVPPWTVVAGNPARVIKEIPENER